ncbi:MAG: ATP-binding cassette domain-containing protein [Candidatus Zixiibacteriota bacterium]|nr:MAG: ATP-binding cassette domain-containing protein [candidate division Zixibacteria bacterium]
MIRLANVSYTYPGGATALRNLSLHISRGEQVAVIGNNGSGKTTLALLLNGVLKADAGEIRVDGLNPSDEHDARTLKQKVGLVFQNPDNQLVSTTVEREVAFSLENMNVPHPQLAERVKTSIELFGLSEFCTRLTSEMSGGEKQRLALASVMAVNPDILILDEPGSYLDESGKRLLAEAVSQLLKQVRDLTVIRITQYAEIAQKYDRVILLKDGKIVMDDSPVAVYANARLCADAGIEIPLKYRMLNGVDFPRQHHPHTRKESKDVPPQNIMLESVHFSYGSGQAVFKGIDVSVYNNRTYGVVGRSGGGKTTLIQLMAGLLEPSRGRVRYSGFRAKPGAIAVSFQQAERQFFLETVDREIRFGAENVKAPNIDKLVAECYSLVGLPRHLFKARNPFTLSGGESRRLAFGTILPLHPCFILFDEPTCALDAGGIRQFKQLVGWLRDDGVGVVIVSHYGDIIFELADEVIVINEGVVETVCEKRAFFTSIDYSGYLSTPELVSFQQKKLGSIKYFSEAALEANIN